MSPSGTHPTAPRTRSCASPRWSRRRTFTVPPDAHGGVENVVAGLVDELVEHGHEVTRWVPVSTAPARSASSGRGTTLPCDQLGAALPEVVHAARIKRPDQHRRWLRPGPRPRPGRTAARPRTPWRRPSSVHGPMADLADLYGPLGRSVALVAISDAQRRTAPDLNWVSTVHNGIDIADFPVPLGEGRLRPVPRALPTPRRRPPGDRRAAAASGSPPRGKCAEPAEREYFDAEVAPRLGPDAVEVGEGRRRREASPCSPVRAPRLPHPLGGAVRHGARRGLGVRDTGRALARGSVPEVVEDGRTGIVGPPGGLAGPSSRRRVSTR